MQETEARRLAEELLGGYRGRESLGRGDTRLDIREIEREACEGQEQGEASLGPAPGTAITSPLPLDQLLAQADLPGGCMYSLTMFLMNLAVASSSKSKYKQHVLVTRSYKHRACQVVP